MTSIPEVIHEDDQPRQSTAIAVRSPQLLRPVASAEEIIASRSEIVNLLPKVLTPEVDYGVIPGTNKQVLLKAGAERVCAIFGCYPTYEIVEREIDHDRVITYRSGWVEAPDPGWDEKDRLKKAGKGRSKKVDDEWVWTEKGEGVSESVGLYRYVVRCRLVRQDGLVIGDGIGVCSTLESKYISRPRECENTALKMAEKRGLVGATLNAFALSDRFTQDVEPPTVKEVNKPQEANKPKPQPEPEAKPAATDGNLAAFFEDLVSVDVSERETWINRLAGRYALTDEQRALVKIAKLALANIDAGKAPDAGFNEAAMAAWEQAAEMFPALGALDDVTQQAKGSTPEVILDEAALFAAGGVAAENGVDALDAWYGGLTASQRLVAKPFGAVLKTRANLADSKPLNDPVNEMDGAP